MLCSIKNLEEAHLYEVCALESLCFENPWNEKQFLDAIHSKNYILTGYFEDEHLRAYLLVSKVDDYVEIINIATDPEHRKKGYAKALLTALFQSPISDTILEVRTKNIAAQNLYAQFNFKEIYVRKAYYGDDDALVMQRVE